MKRIIMRRLVAALFTSGVLCVSSHAMASAFQLWEQDGASIGNYHAGYAALANDASIAWYNPAGITRIKNQQFVLGAVPILTSFKYSGTVDVNTLGFGPVPVVSQGGSSNLIPDLHYVAPITDRIGFGFSVGIPFGLKTDYGRSTDLRYAATLSEVRVIDVSPSLAFQVTDKASIGAGFDVQFMHGEFDQVGAVNIGGLPPDDFVLESTSTNKANDTAYGYHIGALYQFTPNTRAGLSYHAKVKHHLKGTSRFSGQLIEELNDGDDLRSHAKTNITLPAYTAFSVYHRMFPCMAVMGSVIHTQWSSFKNLVLRQISGVEEGEPDSNITVIIPQNFRNTWNFSVGTDFYVNDSITLRAGVGYDQTPVRREDRNVQLPDNNRYVFAFGGHYQASKAVGLDLGYMHVFIKQAHIEPPVQVTGTQEVITSGHVKGGGDVYGVQLTWDIV